MASFQSDNDVGRERVILSMQTWMRSSQPLVTRLVRFGLDASKLPEYGLRLITGESLPMMQSYIAQDLVHVNPDLLQDTMAFQRMVHQCTDSALLAAQFLTDQLYSVFQNQDLSQVRFEGWLGQSILVSRPRTSHVASLSGIVPRP